MVCSRCGAVFDGSFCPRCGAPAAVSPTSFAAPPAPVGWPCPRCGTLFSGTSCPRGGPPTGAWAARPPPRSSMRPVLSILWTLALVAFVAFALTDFAGLAVSPTLIVPGIQGIQSGQTVNSGMDFSGNWTHDSWGTASTSSYQASGGHPDGFLEMRLFGTGARGYWWQSFNVGGSQPYTGSVHLDLRIVGGLTSGQLIVSVDSSNSAPDPNVAIAVLRYSGPTPWTSTGRIGADARLTSRGLYYLKIAFIVDAASGPVDVGIDNARLSRTTDAAVVLYIPVPLPYVVLLFELANAGVYEEIIFRLLLIGLPMAVGSVVLRIMDVNRGATGNGPGSAGRYIGGAWRYLIGGVLRRDSPKEALVAGWAFLFASSAIFGLAHAPGWGYWKVVPSMVAGLGFGYLFLRHGGGAAISAYFVNDYALLLAYEGIGGGRLEAPISPVFIGLPVPGAA